MLATLTAYQNTIVCCAVAMIIGSFLLGRGIICKLVGGGLFLLGASSLVVTVVH